MLRQLAGAVVLLGLSVGLVMAEEFNVAIKKVEGDRITAIKGMKKGAQGAEVTLTTIADVKVVKGKISKQGDKFKVEIGDAIEGGLQNKMFAEIGANGIGAVVTTNHDGKVTQILVFGGKKKKDAE